MINGMHAIVFSPEAEKVRDFFADVIGLSSVDAGGGWLIFALPPAELAVHPADGESRHQLYLMCDDIGATLAELRARGAESRRRSPISAGAWWPRSACPTVPSFPSTSPGTLRLTDPGLALEDDEAQGAVHRGQRGHQLGVLAGRGRQRHGAVRAEPGPEYRTAASARRDHAAGGCAGTPDRSG
jgi:hypothetical protein